MVERLNGIEEVTGSNPVGSTLVNREQKRIRDKFETKNSALDLREKFMDITVRELIERLQHCNPEARIYFETLSFYRIKPRGENIVQIEFAEPVDTETETHVTFRKMSE